MTDVQKQNNFTYTKYYLSNTNCARFNKIYCLVSEMQSIKVSVGEKLPVQ